MADRSEDDAELLAAAEALLRERYDPDRHTTAAALRTAAGGIHTGVSLKARTGVADVHAEPVALARAALDGDGRPVGVVAVQPADPEEWAGDRSGAATRVVTACGRCRELLLAFAPELWLLAPGPDGPRRRPVAELPSGE